MPAKPHVRRFDAKATPQHFARVPLQRQREIPLASDDRIAPPIVETGAARLRWYALTARQHRVPAVVQKLRTAGFEAYAPMRVFWRREHRGDWRIRRQLQAPILGQYVFVGLYVGQTLDPVYETDPLGRNVMEVTGILTNHGRPAPMRCEVLAALAAEERAGWFDEDRRPALEAAGLLKALPPFCEGDNVEILDGPFASFPGLVETDCSGETARVSVQVFGRPTLMVMPVEWLKNTSRPQKTAHSLRPET